MLVEKISSKLQFVDIAGQKVQLDKGYRVRFQTSEVARMMQVAPAIVNELRARSKVESAMIGTELYFVDASRWDTIWRVTAKYGQRMSLEQFRVAMQVVLLPKFVLQGQPAYDAMVALFGFTPGGSHVESKLPLPSKEQLSKMKMQKFFDVDFDKTTVLLTIPQGEIAARLFGKASANIKALGNLFAAEADVHFHIEQFAPEADLSVMLLPD
jgi:hypothetical protein